MSEAIGLAEMTETPLVLVEAMRAGPSTGMPTKTEQADLEFVCYTSQGDSNRVVFAPGNLREAYEQTRDAFRLAYKYHLPAVVLYDQKLGGEMRNVPVSFFDREPAGAGLPATLSEAELAEAAHHASGKFKRFDPDTESGVSPRAIPGQAGGRFLATGNEHVPEGHIEEDPGNRVEQMDKRRQKITSIRAELDAAAASHQTERGPADATFGLLTFGSQQDTVFEAVDRLNEAGHAVKGMGVSELMPYPTEEVADFLASVDECLIVEMNASAQFRGITQKELGRFGDRLGSFLKYDGEAFEPGEIVDAVESRLEGAEPTVHNAKYVPAAGD
jgi:pyruvate ferredoxin oxidoreductase alpha subunit